MIPERSYTSTVPPGTNREIAAPPRATPRQRLLTYLMLLALQVPATSLIDVTCNVAPEPELIVDDAAPAGFAADGGVLGFVLGGFAPGAAALGVDAVPPKVFSSVPFTSTLWLR